MNVKLESLVKPLLMTFYPRLSNGNCNLSFSVVRHTMGLEQWLESQKELLLRSSLSALKLYTHIALHTVA